MQNRAHLDHATLQRLLRYEPETGHFIRIWTHPNHQRFLGKVAGSICPRWGYVCLSINNRRYRAHVLAWFYMTGKWPKHTVDHINRVRTDNRWSNLRDATYAQQSANLSCVKGVLTPSGGLRGTVPRGKRWRARLSHEGKIIYFGSYETTEEAHAAYLAAAQRLKGERFYGGD